MMSNASFKIVSTVFLALVAMWFAAFTTSILWGWFVVPLGVVAISTAHTWGILVILHALMLRLYTPSKMPAIVSIFQSLGISTSALLIGYVLTFFM
jgi:hypothetical protein